MQEHYNYFRDYDPAIGRYAESDPIGLLGGLNTFGYVESSPLGTIDRMGLSSGPPICNGKDCPNPPFCPTPNGPRPCPQPDPKPPKKPSPFGTPKGDECAAFPDTTTCAECCAARNRWSPNNITPCVVKNCTDPRGITGYKPPAPSDPGCAVRNPQVTSI
jgi:hypothetical protein